MLKTSMPTSERIIISTDGSYSETHKIGTWACWITGDNLHVKAVHRIKQPIDDSNICELMAMANALTVLRHYRKLEDCFVIFYTDSFSAIRFLRKGTVKQYYLPVIAFLKPQLDQLKGYRLIHLKGHAYNRYDREYSKTKYRINHWADKAAYKLLQSSIKEVEHGKNKTFTRNQRKPSRSYDRKGHRYFGSRRGQDYKRARHKVKTV